MKSMENRPLSELWKLVLKTYRSFTVSDGHGICHAISTSKLTSKEYSIIYGDFYDNLSAQDKDISLRGGYVWDMFDRKSRIDFIESRIAHHSKTELPC